MQLLHFRYDTAIAALCNYRYQYLPDMISARIINKLVTYFVVWIVRKYSSSYIPLKDNRQQQQV